MTNPVLNIGELDILLVEGVTPKSKFSDITSVTVSNPSLVPYSLVVESPNSVFKVESEKLKMDFVQQGVYVIVVKLVSLTDSNIVFDTKTINVTVRLFFRSKQINALTPVKINFLNEAQAEELGMTTLGNVVADLTSEQVLALDYEVLDRTVSSREIIDQNKKTTVIPFGTKNSTPILSNPVVTFQAEIGNFAILKAESEDRFFGNDYNVIYTCKNSRGQEIPALEYLGDTQHYFAIPKDSLLEVYSFIAINVASRMRSIQTDYTYIGSNLTSEGLRYIFNGTITSGFVNTLVITALGQQTRKMEFNLEIIGTDPVVNKDVLSFSKSEKILLGESIGVGLSSSIPQDTSAYSILVKPRVRSSQNNGWVYLDTLTIPLNLLKRTQEAFIF